MIATVWFALLGVCVAYNFSVSVKDSKGKCLLENKQLKKVNEVWFDKENCERMTCIKTNTSALAIRTQGCEMISTTSRYTICRIENPSPDKPYPDCCPRLNCNGPFRS